MMRALNMQSCDVKYNETVTKIEKHWCIFTLMAVSFDKIINAIISSIVYMVAK